MADIFRAPLTRWLPKQPPRQDWIWSSADTLLAPPFSKTDWPNPVLRVLARQDWVWSTPDALLNPPGSNPTAFLDWKNPLPIKQPNVGDVWGTPDTLTNPPGLTPNYQSDWPNPRGAPYPVELRTFYQTLLPTFAPPNTKPFDLSDWQNPRGPVFPMEERGFILATNILLPIPPAPPPTADSSSTPGRIEDSYEYYRRAREAEEARQRDIDALRITATVDGRLAEYTDKSRKITQAIERLKAEAAAFLAESAALRDELERTQETKRNARKLAEARRQLLLREQALTLAAAQEAALLEELQVIDIAYVSIIALGAILQ